MRRSRSNTLLWVVIIGGAAYFFKDKLIALYHSIFTPASPVAAAAASAGVTTVKTS